MTHKQAIIIAIKGGRSIIVIIGSAQLGGLPPNIAGERKNANAGGVSRVGEHTTGRGIMSDIIDVFTTLTMCVYIISVCDEW